jgi:hypothetical protein
MAALEPSRQGMDRDIIPASWKKAVLTWAFGLVVMGIGALCIVFRWGIAGVPWYVLGPATMLIGLVLIVVWDGFLPFRNQRLIIGPDAFRVVEFADRTIVHIPFSNIEEFHVADHYDRDANARIPDYYLIITLRDAREPRTHGSFQTDEGPKAYLQLTDTYTRSPRDICAVLKQRIHNPPQ